MRLYHIFLTYFVMTSVVIIRLFYLQIFMQSSFFNISQKNITNIKSLPTIRGSIYGSCGNCLAYDDFSFKVEICGVNIEEKIKALEAILNYYPQAKLKRQEILANYSTVVANDIPWSLATILQNMNIPSLIISEGYKRMYPYSKMMAHAIGYVRLNNNMQVGESGTEKSSNTHLSGELKREIRVVNARGFVLDRSSIEKFVLPKDQKISLNSKIQKYAFNLLSQYRRAALCLIDLTNGGIVSLISIPSYDPENLLKNDYWMSVVNHKDSPLLNRVFAGLYPPGSFMKPFVAYTALKTGLITPDTSVICTGKFKIGNRFFRCWKQHGKVNLHDAIAQSCDTYFYSLQSKISLDELQNTLRTCGLFENYNISGFNFSHGKFYSSNIGGERALLLIGQGRVLCSPIEMLIMFSRMCTNKMITPSFSCDTQLFDSCNLNSKYRSIILKAMFGVTSENGTAYGANFRHRNIVRICGKTSTSQVKEMKENKNHTNIEWHEKDHSIFCGGVLNNANNFKYAICVVVEHGGSGGGAAASVACDVLHYAVKNFA